MEKIFHFQKQLVIKYEPIGKIRNLKTDWKKKESYRKEILEKNHEKNEREREIEWYIRNKRIVKSK
jgi:hypothetical protein